MGEKGNLLDAGEEIFANLAEQGPQFWLNYEQYKLSRARARLGAEQQATGVPERDAAGQDATVEFNWPTPRAPE